MISWEGLRCRRDAGVDGRPSFFFCGGMGMCDTNRICKLAQEMKETLITDRRIIHMQPELAFCEEKTSAFVQARLKELGIEYKTGYAKTGIVGLIHGKKGAGRTLLLRADMDALPILEENDVAYRSKTDGRMHACGHDSHVAMLLGAAKLLKAMEQELCGTVKLMFQPAEEGAGGAEPMIEDGLLEEPKVDGALALHVEPTYPCGKIAVKSGALMASPDEFDIIIKGKGGHGAYPHNTVDPVLTAAKVIEGLQSITARNVDAAVPAVVSVCQINGGQFYNVIPGEVRLGGTTRAFDDATRKLLSERIEQVTHGICDAMGADYSYEFRYMYPPLINDAAMTELVTQSACAVVGDENVIRLQTPFMGGEDFSYVANKVPASYFYVGCRNEEKGYIHPWHSANFNLDEDCLPLGVSVFAEAALRFLNGAEQ